MTQPRAASPLGATLKALEAGILAATDDHPVETLGGIGLSATSTAEEVRAVVIAAGTERPKSENLPGTAQPIIRRTCLQ